MHTIKINLKKSSLVKAVILLPVVTYLPPTGLRRRSGIRFG